MTVTNAQLREALHYEPATGVFTWLITRGAVRAGQRAGCSKDGYIYIGIRGIQYYAHRLAWFYMTGDWPPLLDHRDRDKSNNSFDNLRIATRPQNMANSSASRTNTSGARGVSWDRKLGKWVAAITVHGRRQYLGLFPNVDAAQAAYNHAAVSAYGEFAT